MDTPRDPTSVERTGKAIDEDIATRFDLHPDAVRQRRYRVTARMHEVMA